MRDKFFESESEAFLDRMCRTEVHTDTSNEPTSGELRTRCRYVEDFEAAPVDVMLKNLFAKAIDMVNEHSVSEDDRAQAVVAITTASMWATRTVIPNPIL